MTAVAAAGLVMALALLVILSAVSAYQKLLCLHRQLDNGRQNILLLEKQQQGLVRSLTKLLAAYLHPSPEELQNTDRLLSQAENCMEARLDLGYQKLKAQYQQSVRSLADARTAYSLTARACRDFQTHFPARLAARFCHFEEEDNLIP